MRHRRKPLVKRKISPFLTTSNLQCLMRLSHMSEVS
ncbi:Uncharacterised protein [Vibrio cholerae]|nr:Uncharacterised protein [Vibrio cholerae]